MKYKVLLLLFVVILVFQLKIFKEEHMKKSFIHQQQEISFVKNTFTQYLIDKLDIVEVQGLF